MTVLEVYLAINGQNSADLWMDNTNHSMIDLYEQSIELDSSKSVVKSLISEYKKRERINNCTKAKNEDKLL